MFRFSSLVLAGVLAAGSTFALPNKSEAAVPFGVSVDLGRNHVELSHAQRYYPVRPAQVIVQSPPVQVCEPPVQFVQPTVQYVQPNVQYVQPQPVVVVPNYTPWSVGVGFRGTVVVPGHYHHDHHHHH